MDEELKPRPLFGGSINIQLPERFIDISDFRPIPDNQEVFADANIDQSLIIDIMVRIHALLFPRQRHRLFHSSSSSPHLSLSCVLIVTLFSHPTL
jgi:hypothetical protein